MNHCPPTTGARLSQYVYPRNLVWTHCKLDGVVVVLNGQFTLPKILFYFLEKQTKLFVSRIFCDFI